MARWAGLAVALLLGLGSCAPGPRGEAARGTGVSPAATSVTGAPAATARSGAAAAPTAPIPTISREADPTVYALGQLDAPVVIEEYADYQ